jgi:acyl-[acyl-carrier-protein]-phospholipid O-acyltransferase/long-chain-fatty-acid--[acyl-carrier-protein] ligase
MLRFVIRLLVRVLYRFEVRGDMPSGKQLLVIGNHQSFLDAALLWTILPQNSIYIVHTQVLRQWIFRVLLRKADHLVIDTTNPFAMKGAVELIEGGRPVVVFPEGRVTVTGNLMKVYDGPAFLAAKSGATLATFWMDGAHLARGFSRLQGIFPLRWCPKVTLTWMPPQRLPMPEAPTGKLRRRLAGEEMRRILQRARVAARPRRTLAQAFLSAVEQHGRTRQMVEDASGTQMSYGTLLKASLALGRLAGKQTAERENVGVLLPNAAGAVALVFGLLIGRRVPAMLNFTAGVEALNSAIRAARIRVVFTSRVFVERARLQHVIEKLEGVRVQYLEDLRSQLTAADKLWLIGYALRSPRSVLRPADSSEPAAILFTSGSEGKPKGVVLSHDSILSNIEQGLAIFDVNPADRFMSALPIFHSFGLTVGVFLPLTQGMPVFLYPTPLHYAIIPELVYDRDCTVVAGTTTFLKHYAKRAHPYDFRRVRILISGAEKLTEEVRQLYLEKFGQRIIEGYGATECSPIIAANSPFRYKTGTVGELLPGIEHRLEPVEGIEEGGLLHVHGPNVMLGYLRDSNPGVIEAPASPFGPRWYATGDLAVLDDEGFLRLLGRVRRFAKIAGEMVSLETAERVAELASPAAMHAAVARPDPARGEMIILATQDKLLRRDQLVEAARGANLPELAVPRRIIHLDRIPLLGNGKKDYPGVRQIVEELIASGN